MDLAHPCLRVTDQDPPQTSHLARSYLPHKPNKATGDTRPISNSNSMASTAARPAANTVSVEVLAIKLRHKVNKPVNMEVTKALGATTMAIISVAVDGAATTADTNLATFVATRPW
jgi:hypothetical protein